MLGQIWADGGVRVGARNVNTGRLLAGRVGIAADHVGRAVGLLGRGRLRPGEGLWIAPARGVHTCGLRADIDLVGLDADGRIVEVVADLKPWRVRWARGAVVGLLELPAGTVERSGARLGDEVVFEIVRDAAQTRNSRAA